MLFPSISFLQFHFTKNNLAHSLFQLSASATTTPPQQAKTQLS